MWHFAWLAPIIVLALALPLAHGLARAKRTAAQQAADQAEHDQAASVIVALGYWRWFSGAGRRQ